jgi:type IV pilus assembly protein PilO
MALPAIFDPILNAPTSQKSVVGVMGLAIIGAAAYFLLISPLEIKVAQLRTQEASLQRDLTQNRAILADFAKYRREAAELEVKINALKEKLPSDREMPSLYRTLTDAGTQAGLAVTLFQPRAAAVKDYYAEIPITVNAEGSYHGLGEFFERVARLPRVVNVKDLKLSAGTRPGYPVRAELVLATYQYRPVGSPRPGPAK